MKKGFKKLVAVALSAGLFASSFAGGVTVQAEDAKEVKKGTVITDFKEVKNVNDLVPGTQYFFSTEEFGAEDAVAALPDGSAILQFAGTNLDKAIEDGGFLTPEDREYLAALETLETYADYRVYMKGLLGVPTTEQEAYEIIADKLGLSKVPTSWEELTELAPGALGGITSISQVITLLNQQYEADYPESEESFLSEEGCSSWNEFKEAEIENYQYMYENEKEYFSGENVQQEQQGYVRVIRTGEGFDTCFIGTIAYLTEETETMSEQLQSKWSESKYDGPGWYYGCDGGGVGYVGPFYLYSYKVNEFTEDDLIITFAEDWKTPTAATTVTKDDLTLSVVIDGEEIIIPFFEITDSSVDPANENTTITLVVGEITKVVEVCNIESGEIVKDVQISAGAPTVGLEDAVDALMETVLTEAELKLVKNGVDVDIYMTVVGKKAEELGEDKAILEKTMAKDDKAVYLDLKLFKKIGNNDPTAITEVSGGKIKVSVVVPDTIKKFADKAKVVRVHGTEVTELKTTYDAATNKLSFETDKFSTYAIVYNDASSETGTTPTPGTGTTPAPIAGDSAMIGVYMVVVVLAAAVVVMRKKAANV